MSMLWKFGMNLKWRNGAKLPMRHYHDLNLKTDILLLADIFKEFRNICIEYNRLGFAIISVVQDHQEIKWLKWQELN